MSERNLAVGPAQHRCCFSALCPSAFLMLLAGPLCSQSTQPQFAQIEETMSEAALSAVSEGLRPRLMKG
jgi:hypothetical protein